MGEFLSGPDLSEAIREIRRQRPLCCAVAYWGPRARNYFRAKDLTGVRIVCDLGANGTDPNTIAALMAAGAEVRDRPELHAKVYLGGGKAIVASANASARGLEEGGFAARIEAGVRLTEFAEVTAWFEQVFDDSRRVGPELIANEKARRSLLPAAAPTKALPFGRYQIPPDFPECPMFCWYDGREEGRKDRTGERAGNFSEEAVRDFFGEYPPEYISALANRLDIDTIPFNDFHNAIQFKSGSFLWLVKDGDEISGNDCFFSHSLPGCFIFPKAKLFNGEWTDALYSVENRGLDPWDATDPIFRAALLKVLGTDEFKPLISDYDGPWGTVERLALVKKLWPAVQKEYLRPTA
ncbi:phospholipase D family protein [Phaeospirillum tilakii]|uniref:Phospholipase D-like domain-containing protein n=1 Tax=Phaeospirillum tilakii TaxID=741673 RepID=A0ABW5CF23_9PROT